MCISGTEPSSVILFQAMKFYNLKSDSKNAETSLNQTGWRNKPTKLQLQLNHRYAIGLVLPTFEFSVFNMSNIIYEHAHISQTHN